jgi:simple sugar transport system permease protein
MSNQIEQSPETITPKKSKSNTFHLLINRDPNLTRLFIILLLVYITMASLSPRVFLSFDGLSSMAFQFPEFGILALAMMITMISGGIDLSIVGIANLTSIIAAMIMVNFIPAGSTDILTIFAAIVAALMVGVLCGLFNGFAVSIIGIPPILVTLGTMQLFMGIAIVLTEGKAIVGLPEVFSAIGNGSIGFIPFPLIIFVLCVFIAHLLVNKRAFGLKLQMLGANPIASRFSGINNTVVLFKTYAISGLFASISGLLIVAHTNSAKADYGVSYILQAILIAVMGGVSAKGGFGKVSGVVMAVLTLQFLSSGLGALHVGNFFKDFMWGFVLLLVMVVNDISNRIQEKKQSQKIKLKMKQMDGGQKI